MHDEPMMIDETEDFAEPRRGARRSWKKFQLLVAGLVAVLVAWVAAASPASNNWNTTFGGITEAHIAKFEQAMDKYFDEVEKRNLTRVTMARYDSLQPDEYSEAEEVEKGTYDARERVRKLVDGMNYFNRQKARAQFAFRVHERNGDPIPNEVFVQGIPGDGRAWIMRNIPAGVWTAIKAAVIAFVATWLLLKLCELFWWFLIDRVRDVADAVRKS